MSKSSEVGSIPYNKENNVEYSLFQIQGRITRKAFFFRFVLCVIVWLIFHVVYLYWAKADYDYYTKIGGGKIQAGAVQIGMRYKIFQIMDSYIIPCILSIFAFIQAAKRAHDVNKSSLLLLIPLYNFYLIFAIGTDGNNDYGLVPHPEKKAPKYTVEET